MSTTITSLDSAIHELTAAVEALGDLSVLRDGWQGAEDQLADEAVEMRKRLLGMLGAKVVERRLAKIGFVPADPDEDTDDQADTYSLRDAVGGFRLTIAYHRADHAKVAAAIGPALEGWDGELTDPDDVDAVLLQGGGYVQLRMM